MYTIIAPNMKTTYASVIILSNLLLTLIIGEGP